MAHDKLNPVVTQEELLPYLAEDLAPDAYIVIPVAVLAKRLELDWYAVGRENRGEVKFGALAIRFQRSLKQLGFLVDTKHTKASK